MLRFELPLLPYRFNEPRVVWETYTWTMGRRSTLRKMLEVWRGKAMTDTEASQMNMEVLVGKPVYVTVAHKAGAQGPYAKIASVSHPPRNAPGWPAQVLPSILFNVLDFHDDELRYLPRQVLEKVLRTEEFAARQGSTAGLPDSSFANSLS